MRKLVYSTLGPSIRCARRKGSAITARRPPRGAPKLRAVLFNPLKITFIGHACLCLEYKTRRLLTDPYSPEIGYAPIETRTDFVTISHENRKYHSCLDEFEQFDGAPNAIYRGLEHLNQTVRCGPFGLQAIEVFEKLPDDDGKAEGANAMTIIEAGDLRILHMGDCGHLPTKTQIEACGRVDILLALAGAGPTIALPDLLEFIVDLGPQIIIPMHFGLPHVIGKFGPLSDLEKLWPGEIAHKSSSCQISRDDLPDSSQLWILPPLRQQ